MCEQLYIVTVVKDYKIDLRNMGTSNTRGNKYYVDIMASLICNK